MAYGSPTADSLQVAQLVVSNSEHVKPMVAHRPSSLFPTLAAKSFATIDQIGRGRLAVHITSGGNDIEQRREGDYLTKPQRYERSAEFIQLLRRVWSEDGPIDHEGRYYKFEDFRASIRPYQDAIPVAVGGSSPEAHRVAGQNGDIYGVWGEPLAEVAEQIAAVSTHADQADRLRPRIWVSFRPIVAATGASGSSSALVGSYETVARALIDYVDIGCELLSLRGWDPLNDAIEYGKHVLTLVRQELAHRVTSVPSA